MLKISNLIKKVDRFYDSALKAYKLQKLAAPQTFTMADDPDDLEEEDTSTADLSNKLLELGRKIPDPNARTQAALIFQMYQKALQMGAGFGSVKEIIDDFIDNQMDDVDPDDDENPLLDLEEVLLDIRGDADRRIAASGGEDDQADAAVDDIQRQFESDLIEFQTTNNGAGGLSEIDPAAAAKFDLSGGVSAETAATKGRGHSVSDRANKTLVEKIDTLDEERKKYIEALAKDDNPTSVMKKQKIIQLIDQIKSLQKVEDKAYEENQTVGNTPEKKKKNELTGEVYIEPAVTVDQEAKRKLDEITEQLKKLKAEKSNLKSSLRTSSLTDQNQKLEDELAEANRKGDKKAKFLIEQKIELNNVLKSQDKNKGKEVALRKALVSYVPSMGTGAIGAKYVHDLQTQIQEAAKLKIPIQEVWKEQGRVLKEKKEKLDFEGVLIKFRQHLPNVKRGDKKKILDREADRLIRQASDAEQIKYKRFLEKIALAKQSGNTKQVHDAIVDLQKALNGIVEEFDELKRVVNQYAVFTEWKDALIAAEKSGLLAKDTISSSEKDYLNKLIEAGNRVMVSPGIRSATVEFIDTMNTLLRKHIKQSSLTGTPGAAPPKAVQPTSKPLPPEIEIQDDPKTGKKIYVNIETGEFTDDPEQIDNIKSGSRNASRAKFAQLMQSFNSRNYLYE